MFPMPISSERHVEWVKEALDKFESPLIRYAARLTGNIESGRDVVQDTFLRLCTADRTKIEDHLAQWLYTVCRNRALDMQRKRSRHDALDQSNGHVQGNGTRQPDEIAEQNDTQRFVLEMVDTFAQRDQEVFRLKFEHDLTYREISAILDVPVSTIGYVITKSLKEIRTHLEKEMDAVSELSKGCEL